MLLEIQFCSFSPFPFSHPTNIFSSIFHWLFPFIIYGFLSSFVQFPASGPFHRFFSSSWQMIPTCWMICIQRSSTIFLVGVLFKWFEADLAFSRPGETDHMASTFHEMFHGHVKLAVHVWWIKKKVPPDFRPAFRNRILLIQMHDLTRCPGPQHL